MAPAPFDRTPDDPFLVYDFTVLRDHAQGALARRREAYPDLVARGRMDGDEAERDIEAWQAIAAEWEWIATGTGFAPSPGSLAARIAGVELALARADGEIGKGNRDADLHHQRDCNIALRRHYSELRNGEPRVHLLARVNHCFRAEPAETVLCSLCERRREDPATADCTRPDCGLVHRRAA